MPLFSFSQFLNTTHKHRFTRSLLENIPTLHIKRIELDVTSEIDLQKILMENRDLIIQAIVIPQYEEIIQPSMKFFEQFTITLMLG